MGSLSQTMGLAGPFSGSDFLIEHNPSILGDLQNKIIEFQFIMLIMELKSGNPTHLESETILE